jgi:hypothetical protein
MGSWNLLLQLKPQRTFFQLHDELLSSTPGNNGKVEKENHACRFVERYERKRVSRKCLEGSEDHLDGDGPRSDERSTTQDIRPEPKV